MGNCLGKRSRRNRVSPDPTELEQSDVSEVIGGATPFRKPSPSEEMDMVKDLANKGQEPTVSGGGVSFTVDFQEGCPNRMPSRLAERLDDVQVNRSPKPAEVVYTDKEKELLAALFREDILREKREKAFREDIKVYDAAMRRLNKAACHDARTESRTDKYFWRGHEAVGLVGRENKFICKETPDVSERRRRVKKMADKARRNAADASRNE